MKKVVSILLTFLFLQGCTQAVLAKGSFIIDGDYIRGVSEKISAEAFLADFENVTKVYGINGEEIDSFVGTGCYIKSGGKAYTVIVNGDTNGDGIVNSTDFMQIRKCFLGVFKFKPANLEAADSSGDGKVNSTDYMQVRRHFLGTYNLFVNAVGTPNTEIWETEKDVDYSKYDFLGRGEELIKEVDDKYSDYSVTYVLDGKTVYRSAVDSVVNAMAQYVADKSSKKLTVNIDTIEIRVLCEYTSLKAKSGEFIVVKFTANLPTKFIGSIGEKGSTKGEVCHEGITPEGENGTYIGKIKNDRTVCKSGVLLS